MDSQAEVPIPPIITAEAAASLKNSDLPSPSPETVSALAEQWHLSHVPGQSERQPRPSGLLSLAGDWRLLTDRPGSPIVDSSPETSPDSKPKDIKSEAQAIVESPDYRSYLSTTIYHATAYHPGLEVRDWTNRPQQLDALICLLHQSGLDTSSSAYSPDKRNLPATINIALSTLLNNGPQQLPSWSGGLEFHYPRQNVAVNLYDKLQEEIGSKNITQTDFDVCVATALACGDPVSALELIQSARKFLPSQGDFAVNNAVSRNLYNREISGNKVFDWAYDHYLDKLRENLIASLASISQGRLSELGSSQAAQTGREKSEKMLVDLLKSKRESWYRSQSIADVDARLVTLNQTGLSELVDQTAQSGKGHSELVKTLETRAGLVADGIIANSLAAELQRRIHPELSLESQYQAAIEATQNGLVYDSRPSYYPTNYYGPIYGSYGHAEISPAEKTQKINAVFLQKQKLGEAFGDPVKFNLDTLIQFIKVPSGSVSLANSVISDLRREAAERYRFSHSSYGDSDSPEKFQERELEFYRRLVSGLNFLQTAAQNPETRRILETEFGLQGKSSEYNRTYSKITDPDYLEYVSEKVHGWLAGIPDQPPQKQPGSPVEPAPVFDSVDDRITVETRLDDQTAEDTRVIDLLADSRQSEVDHLTAAATAETTAVCLTKVSEVKARLSELTSRRNGILQARSAPETDRQKTTAVLSGIQNQLSELDKVKPVSAVAKLFKPGSMTSADIADQKSRLSQSLTEAQNTLSFINSRLQEIGTFDDTTITSAQQQLAGYQKLPSA